MQKKLFKRFGLFIATEIAKKQRGRIWVESTPNEDSTFCFTLPFDFKEIAIFI